MNLKDRRALLAMVATRWEIDNFGCRPPVIGKAATPMPGNRLALVGEPIFSFGVGLDWCADPEGALRLRAARAGPWEGGPE